MNRHELRTPDFLDHMLEASLRIQRYTSGMDESAFLSNILVQDAVVRNIGILGEASKNLLRILPEASSKFPEIPFAAIYAMRNQLEHGYFSTSLARVWEVVKNDVPELIAALETAIASLS